MPVELPLILLNNSQYTSLHIGLEIVLNEVNGLFIVDTGATNSILDLGRMERFHISRDRLKPFDEKAVGLGSAIENNYICKIQSLQFGEIELKNLPLVLMDLNNVQSVYREMGMDPIDGIIGSDLLLTLNANISFRKKTIKFYQPSKSILKFMQMVID